jgi:hypothetical protein
MKIRPQIFRPHPKIEPGLTLMSGLEVEQSRPRLQISKPGYSTPSNPSNLATTAKQNPKDGAWTAAHTLGRAPPRQTDSLTQK